MPSAFYRPPSALTPSRTPAAAWLLLRAAGRVAALFVVAPTACSSSSPSANAISSGASFTVSPGRITSARSIPLYLRDPPALGRLRRADDRRLPARGLPAGVFHRAAPGPRVRGYLLLLVMIPFWTSFLIRTYAWITILSHDGLLNGLLVSARCSPSRPTCFTPPARSCSG